jgi:transposase InsO family protein
VLASFGIEAVKIPVRSPRANAIAERWGRTVREDCLDHLLVLSRRHLEAILGEYVEHYNRARPHRGQQLAPPVPRSISTLGTKVIRTAVPGGIMHEYELAA